VASTNCIHVPAARTRTAARPQQQAIQTTTFIHSSKAVARSHHRRTGSGEDDEQQPMVSREVSGLPTQRERRERREEREREAVSHIGSEASRVRHSAASARNANTISCSCSCVAESSSVGDATPFAVEPEPGTEHSPSAALAGRGGVAAAAPWLGDSVASG
jgi:hypothetical protein